MFDSLLGRKFTVRCKQAIKCINVRLRVIRKRKQAMLNFLRQDIADLLRDGHDANALNRMDALIVEINHLACYDMIQKFCESILKQISLLQKQRECPAEEKEAVSTLIFAAARFSDLPELCDLRHTFMSRYGSALETSVSLEFIEKLASRTFPKATKIHLMQKTAQEFSVEWVSETLEYGSSGEKNDGMCQAPINTVKDVVATDPIVIGLEPEPKRRSKICDGELENVNPYPPDTSIPHYVHPKRDKDGGYTSPRAREVLDQIDQGGKVLDGSKVHGRCWMEAKLESGSDDTRKQAARGGEFEDNVKPVKIPPHLKSKAVRDALQHSDDWDEDEIPKAAKDADLAAGKRQMEDDHGSFHMTPPPYLKVKPKVMSATVDNSDSSSPPTGGDGAFAARNKSSNVGNGDPRRGEVVVDHERPKPRSVRRNKKLSPVAQESDDAVGSDEPMRGGIHHGQRRHVARKCIFPHQDGRDSEEEEDINRLLTHYSEKKAPHQSRNHREEKTDARPADHARDRCGVDQNQTSEQHNDNKLESPRSRFAEHVSGDRAVICRQYIDMRDSNGKSGSAQSLSVEQMNRSESGRRLMYYRHHAEKPELVLPRERAVTFPPEPLAVGKVEGPARVASMQPDALSPSGGHAHPNLPDYEEFAARFAALRRG